MVRGEGRGVLTLPEEAEWERQSLPKQDIYHLSKICPQQPTSSSKALLPNSTVMNLGPPDTITSQ